MSSAGGRRQRRETSLIRNCHHLPGRETLQGYLAHKKLPSPWQVDGGSALHLACLYGLAPLIGPLIAQGADVTPRNWSEFTLSSW